MSDLRMAIAGNIRTTRKKLGLSQDELAEVIGAKSSETISQIERGEREVKAWELNEIAKRLHVDFYDLLSEHGPQFGPEPLWRKEPATDKADTEAWLLLRSKYYRQVMDLLGICPSKQLPYHDDLDVISATYETVNSLGEEVCQTLGLGPRPSEGLFRVLDDYCVMVFYADLGSDGSAVTVRGPHGPAMLLNSSEPPWRRNFSCAHELFHLLTWNSTLRQRPQPASKRMASLETHANIFASALLMPEAHLIEALRNRLQSSQLTSMDIIALAREFDVSTAALLWRLSNMHVISQEVPEKLLNDPQFKQEDRRTMGGSWYTPEALPRRFVVLAFVAYTRGLLSRARLAEMLETDLLSLPALLTRYGVDLEPEVAYQAKIPDPGCERSDRASPTGTMVAAA